MKRHRVVIFRDFEGREIHIVTDLMGVTAEQIVLMYKYVGNRGLLSLDQATLEHPDAIWHNGNAVNDLSM